MFTDWLHRPREFRETDNGLLIHAPEKTDFFNDPVSGETSHGAPLYHCRPTGDFSLECEVRPEFGEVYDAGGLMFYVDPQSWIKFAFERTDAGYDGVVSVITNGASDDANGPPIDAQSVHLKISRRDQIVGMYYRTGGPWRMARLARFPVQPEAQPRLGVTAQSPVGNGCTVEFRELQFSETPVTDFRKGT